MKLNLLHLDHDVWCYGRHINIGYDLMGELIDSSGEVFDRWKNIAERRGWIFTEKSAGYIVTIPVQDSYNYIVR